MRQTLASLFALFVATLTLTLGSGYLSTFLSLKMKTLEAPDWLVGIVMSGYYLGLVLGARLCHRVLQRVGHIRAFAVFAALNSAIVLAHGIFVIPMLWFPLRVLTGISMMGLFMVVESWLNERSPREFRARVFSFYMIMQYVGSGAGQYLLNIGAITEPVHFFVIGMLFALCLLPVSLTRTMHPAPIGAVSFNWSRIYKPAPFGLLGVLVSGVINGSFYGLAPIYARTQGLDLSQVANFMAATIVGGLLLQYPVGMLSDRFERRLMLALLFFASGSVGALLAIGGADAVWLMYLSAALFGGAAFTIYPVAVAHTHDHFDASKVVVVSAALLVVYGLGATIGPLLASVAMWLLGARGLFLFVATVALLFSLVALLSRRVEPEAVAAQEPFVSVPPSTSPVINTLDPRAGEEQARVLEEEDLEAAEEEHEEEDNESEPPRE